jgi:glycosyltransferase involved in cell wall biosynthesis
MLFVQFAIAAMNVNFWSVRSLCKKFADAGTPVVVAYHEPAREYDLLGIVTRSMYKSIARVTTVPVVFSGAGREALTANHLFNEVVEVPHGTTGVATIADEDTKRVREIYQVRKPLVLTIGFTNADKGADVLLDAASSIAENLGNEVQFLIAGSPRRRRGVFRLMEYRDVRFQRRLQDQATSIPDVDIAFAGFVADRDISALLFIADVVVLPYRSITQSGIANLALASRAVVVCSDLPGLRSDLGDAATYVPVGDLAAIAETVSNLLRDENASLRQHMRELSEQRATANTYATVAEKILSVGIAEGEK